MKFSIMGDSISTFEGYNPFLYDVFYDEKRAKQAGLDSVNDTWWMQVINYFGGELCVNDSYSGSFVAGATDASAHSLARVANLQNEEGSPDVVLVCIGANDCGGKIALHSDDPEDEFAFDTTYTTMLRRIKETLPNAKIYCATIMLTDKEALETRKIRQDYVDSYNQIIRNVAKEQGCGLLEMFDKTVGYTTIDGMHPDKAGHNLIAKLIIKGIEGNKLF